MPSTFISVAADGDVCDFTRAASVRPGGAGEVAQLSGHILSQGVPCVLVRLGRARVVIVLFAECAGNFGNARCERERHPPGPAAWSWLAERGGWRAA